MNILCDHPVQVQSSMSGKETRMKKRAVISIILILSMLLAMTLSACGSGGGDKNTINLYCDGSDNVRIVWEAVIAAFNAKKTGVTVNLQFLASGAGGQTGTDKLIAAIQAKQKTVDIDILETDENKLVRILKEGSADALTKMDAAKIPNLKNITGKSIIAPDTSMAFRGTAVFLAYNSDKVKNPPKTDKELIAWIKANPGRFAYNDPATGGAGSSFVLTSVYNAMPAEALTSTDDKWMAQWDAGFNLLKEIHPFLYKASGKVQYTVKNQGSLDLLAAGSIDMCPAWADMVLDQKSKKLLPASIMLTQIDPMLTGSITTIVIPKLSSKSEAAFKFFDFVASVEAQEIFVTVMKAIPVIDPSKLQPATIELLSGLKQSTYRTATIGGLGTKMNERWTKDISTLP